jgi:hypothetical protein
LILKTKVDGLSVVWPQNHSDCFRRFGLKTDVTVCSGLASKPAATVFSSLSSKLVAAVSPDLASKPAVGFLLEPQNQGGGGFLGLGLKTGSSSLVIWALKSPQRFLDLGLKTGSSSLVIWALKSPQRFLDLGLNTKWASVCRLRHKTDGGRSASDTRRDLAAFFMWNQVWLGFSSLA